MRIMMDEKAKLNNWIFRTRTQPEHKPCRDSLQGLCSELSEKWVRLLIAGSPAHTHADQIVQDTEPCTSRITLDIDHVDGIRGR